MEKRIKTWFHLKTEFSSFKLIPQEHAHYLFGTRDQKIRDDLLMALKECAYSESGYHAIIWGPAGRGKTHLANNLRMMSMDHKLPLEIVYVDCPTIRSAKEPLKTFFSAIFKSMSPKVVRRFVLTFVQALEANPQAAQKVLQELNNDKTVYKAIIDGLVLPNDNTVKNILGWLGGEQFDINNISEGAPRQIESGEQIARNIGAIGEILLVAEGKNLIFLVDEAERLLTIQSGEAFWAWLSALRECFRRPSVGIMMFILAQSIDYLPQILMEHEIFSRIGSNNIISSPPFTQPDAESFLRQLLDSMIQKNPVPDSLQEVLNDSKEPLDCYPFTSDAFTEFIQHHSIGTTDSKPQELLNNLERCAQRAISLDKKLIDMEVLQQIIHGI